jgi:cysteine desulfurase/selenocysteine lyase
MDINKIRQDFPFYSSSTSKKPQIYLDTACQSLRPQVVIDAINQYYVIEPACGGRSNHHLSAAVSHRVDQVRETTAKFFHASRKEEIIFTRNTTEGINLVANSLGLKSGDTL